MMGITQEAIDRDGLTIESVLPDFVDFIGDLRLVSFNAEFDLGFLKAAAKPLFSGSNPDAASNLNLIYFK
jgi:DNA polymerase III subunit epsilon